MVPEGARAGALTPAPDERARDNRAQYDALAATFDANDAFWSNPYDRATWDLENALVARYLSGADLLLDLGVGFYPHVESTAGRRVLCLDVSDGSLRVARAVYHDRNPRTRYVCGDALALPLADRSVDAVVAGGELVNHLDGGRLLAEMHRVLKPSGRVVLSIAMKWCLDNLYCLADAVLGTRLGYAMTRAEAAAFVARPMASSDVTWSITPDTSLPVTLYTRRHLRELLAASGFRLLAIRSLNGLSGIVPLPVQQDPQSSTLTRAVTTMLLALDRTIVGRIPGVRWLAGNVYLVLEKPA